MRKQYAVKIFPDSLVSAKFLRGIRRQTVRTGSEVRTEALSGELYARFGALYAQKPIAEFSTVHVASALATCGQTGLRIASGTNTGLTLYEILCQDGGTEASGSVHRSKTIREGLLIPRRLTCGHQADAEINYECLVTYDGTNDPIVLSDTVAIPSTTEADERFTLGPITIGNGSTTLALDKTRNLEVDFGIQAESVGTNSDVWDTASRIVEILPSVMVTGIDPTWFKSTAIPLTGLKIEHANTSIVLRKRKDGSTFYDADEAEHVLLTVSGCAYIDQLFDAQGNALGECTLRIPLTFDGTNAPIVVTTGSTYS